MQYQQFINELPARVEQYKDKTDVLRLVTKKEDSYIVVDFVFKDGSEPNYQLVLKDAPELVKVAALVDKAFFAA
jgi:hypothetical protein